MLIVGGSSASGYASTMGAMTIVIIGEYFGSISCAGVVYCIVKGHYFRVVCSIVIIKIVQGRVISIDSGVYDCHCHTSPGVARILPY